MKIQAVTLDVGGTLIEPWPSVGDLYAEVAARHGMRVSAADLNRQFDTAWRARKNFGYTLSAWSGLVTETFAGLVETPPDESFFSELYERFTDPSAWRIFPDAMPALKALRKNGLKLGAISNWDERLRPLLEALKLDQALDVIVISAEIGLHKPDAKIFREAALRLEVPPESILHVGDSLMEDLEGARAARLDARLLNRSRTGADGSEIGSLLDLLTLPEISGGE